MTHALDFAGARFEDAATEVSSVLVSCATTEDCLSRLFSASALVARSSPDSVAVPRQSMPSFSNRSTCSGSTHSVYPLFDVTCCSPHFAAHPLCLASNRARSSVAPSSTAFLCRASSCSAESVAASVVLVTSMIRATYPPCPKVRCCSPCSAQSKYFCKPPSTFGTAKPATRPTAAAALSTLRPHARYGATLATHSLETVISKPSPPLVSANCRLTGSTKCTTTVSLKKHPGSFMTRRTAAADELIPPPPFISTPAALGSNTT
mmetsp:Transcript_11457/g.27888  ORF Transcript_11457/g.27888 Transcript_11457/m.27888 type:complete len:263 (-) Transcript_11457:1786-2574(-)